MKPDRPYPRQRLRTFIVSGLTFRVDQWAGVIRHPSAAFIVSDLTFHVDFGFGFIRNSSFAIRNCICIGSLANYACLLARVWSARFRDKGLLRPTRAIAHRINDCSLKRG
jgi:hypothetical protein